MKRKIVPLALMLFFLVSIAHAKSTSYKAEDSATVVATVLGFDKDQENNALIKLQISEINDYFHNLSAVYEPLNTDQIILVGFLWGHKLVNTYQHNLKIGDKISGSIGYHYNFTSHTGHLYNYEKLCNSNEEFVGGQCIQVECKSDEHLVDNLCQKLQCNHDQLIINHTCVNIPCSDDEYVLNQKCIKLNCGENEYASGNTCNSLDCNQNQKIENHSCVNLLCSRFQETRSSECAINFKLVMVLFASVSSILFFGLTRLLLTKNRKVKSVDSTRKNLTLIYLTALSLLSIPFAIRYFSGQPFLVNTLPYKTAIITERLMSSSIQFDLFNKNLSIYHILLSKISVFSGIEIASVLTPLVLGVLTACIFYLLVQNITKDNKISLIMTLVLITSPSFIYLFAISSPSSLIAFSLVFAIYLIAQGKTRSILLSWPVLFALSIQNIYSFVVCCLAVLLLIIKKPKKRLIGLAIFITIFLAGLYSSLFIHPPQFSFNEDFIRESVTDLGAVVGFGIFNILLVCLGIIKTWRQKKKFLYFYILLLITSLLNFSLSNNYNAFLNFILAFLAGYGFVLIYKRKWQLPMLKKLTILLVICGLAFSTASYQKRISAAQPNQDMIDALKWLKHSPEGIVLSHNSYSSWIEYIGKKQPLTVADMDSSNQIISTEEILQSRDFYKTKEFLETYNVTYILVNDVMKNGLVWGEDKQGLIFLFRNNETFKKIYSNPSTEIWQFITQ